MYTKYLNKKKTLEFAIEKLTYSLSLGVNVFWVKEYKAFQLDLLIFAIELRLYKEFE